MYNIRVFDILLIPPFICRQICVGCIGQGAEEPLPGEVRADAGTADLPLQVDVPKMQGEAPCQGRKEGRLVDEKDRHKNGQLSFLPILTREIIFCLTG